MAAMLAASLGSVASASESGITFPLEESYSFSIMTRAENDSEQDFSKKALVQRMEAACLLYTSDRKHGCKENSWKYRDLGGIL